MTRPPDPHTRGSCRRLVRHCLRTGFVERNGIMLNSVRHGSFRYAAFRYPDTVTIYDPPYVLSRLRKLDRFLRTSQKHIPPTHSALWHRKRLGVRISERFIQRSLRNERHPCLRAQLNGLNREGSRKVFFYHLNLRRPRKNVLESFYAPHLH